MWPSSEFSNSQLGNFKLGWRNNLPKQAGERAASEKKKKPEQIQGPFCRYLSVASTSDSTETVAVTETETVTAAVTAVKSFQGSSFSSGWLGFDRQGRLISQSMVSTTSNVLATIGTVCWCVQLIPQLIHNYRRKNTEGFPELMAFLWFMCAPFFAVFVVIENASIPIMIQPHLFGFFCWLIYIQVMYYPPVQRPRRQIILRAGSCLLFQIVLELACIIPLRKLYNEGTHFPTIIFGVMASILLAIGLVPPYFELAKRNGRVIGINFLFLLVDFSGAIFSLASLAVNKGKLDIMGLVLYLIVAAMEFGIFFSQFVWLIRFRLFKSNAENDSDTNTDLNLDLEAASTNSDCELDPEITKIDNDTACVGKELSKEVSAEA